jgi:LmbE family N-acetylglucosaminyl deacetylase
MEGVRVRPDIVTALPPWGTVLVVGAHPDDESLGMGAVVDAFARAGTSIAVLTFTQGEASTLQGAVGDLAAVRAGELAAAERILGVEHSELLHYPDGRLAEHDLTELAEQVERVAQAVGADGLLVFDERGITGHPDHRWATRAALVAAARIGLPVLAWVIPDAVASRLNVEFRTSFVGRSDDDIHIALRVDRSRQRSAIAEHHSQSVDNPVMWRRIELLGDSEWLRWLRAPGTEPMHGPIASSATSAVADPIGGSIESAWAHHRRAGMREQPSSPGPVEWGRGNER